jgi:hypothetical protein
VCPSLTRSSNENSPRFFALSIASLSATAANETTTCDEYQQFAYGVTVARDRGTKELRAKELIDEMREFNSSEKKALKGMIHEIYSTPEMGPAVLGEVARMACMKNGKRKGK